MIAPSSGSRLAPSDSDGVARRIRQFVEETYAFREAAATVSDDDHLFELGIIDSFGVLNLVTFLEEAFEFRVADEDVVPENLSSVGRMAIYVRGKLSAK